MADIPEPPDGTMVVIDLYGSVAVHTRCDNENPTGDPLKRWKQVSGPSSVLWFSWEDLNEYGPPRIVGEPVGNKTVSLSQMQDGKRYRVVFEGVWDKECKGLHPSDEGWLPDHKLADATRIEEILYSKEDGFAVSAPRDLGAASSIEELGGEHIGEIVVTDMAEQLAEPYRSKYMKMRDDANQMLKKIGGER